MQAKDPPLILKKTPPLTNQLHWGQARNKNVKLPLNLYPLQSAQHTPELVLARKNIIQVSTGHRQSVLAKPSQKAPLYCQERETLTDES